MRKKFLMSLVSIGLIGTIVTGCGKSAEVTKDIVTISEETESVALADLPEKFVDGVVAVPEMYTGVDMSDQYTVSIYLIGDKPTDWDVVQEKINEYLKPFNTDIKTTFMSWSDYQTMYPLVLAGGEDVDMIFTAPWCYMYTEAQKGSFYALDEEFRNRCMPLSMKYQAPESWEETTLAGKCIAVPCNSIQPNGKMVAIRQDIADKYGITELNSWDDYMNFCLIVAENETPENGILAMAAAGGNEELWDVYRQQYDTFYALQSGSVSMIYQDNDGNLPEATDIKFTFDTDIFRGFARDMKKLADAGAWSRSALNETVTDDDAFGNLQGASIAWNTTVFNFMDMAEKTDGVHCEAYLLSKDHLVTGEAYSNGDMAITLSSGNPDRTAMVLDIMKNDIYLNHLIMLGIENVHYTMNEDGTYTELEKAEDYPYGMSALSWAIRNGDLKESGMDPRKAKIIEEEEAIVRNCPTVAFVFDTAPVQAQIDAVNTVLDDYVDPLQLGLVDNTDATIDEMLADCKKAGLDDVVQEFFSQYNAWKDQK